MSDLIRIRAGTSANEPDAPARESLPEPSLACQVPQVTTSRASGSPAQVPLLPPRGESESDAGASARLAV